MPSAPMPADAVADVPSGRWAVGVSGGADSVALLTLLRDRPDLALHVVHLNHQTRGDDSDADAAFVSASARAARLPVTHAMLADVLAMLPHPPPNASARYRAARLGLFARVVQSHDLAGVLLAHHADDQAETVLQRLLRGSGPMGLAGMSPRTCVGGLTIVRPLLAVRRAALRAELARRGVDWREDASNATDAYARNRLRKLLADRDDLVNDLLALGGACGQLRAWVDAHAPLPADVLRPSDLDGLPDVLRRAVLAKWLRAAGVPDVEPGAVERLLAMLTDAATGARQTFAGNVSVRRRGGVVFVHRG